MEERAVGGKTETRLRLLRGQRGAQCSYDSEEGLFQLIQCCIDYRCIGVLKLELPVEERAVGGKTETRLRLSRGQRGRGVRHEILPGLRDTGAEYYQMGCCRVLCHCCV